MGAIRKVGDTEDPKLLSQRLTPELSGYYSQVKPTKFKDIKSRDQFIAHLPTVEVYMRNGGKEFLDFGYPYWFDDVSARFIDKILKLREAAPRGPASTRWSSSAYAARYLPDKHIVEMNPDIFKRRVLYDGAEVGPKNYPDLYKKYYGKGDTPLMQIQNPDLAEYIRMYTTADERNNFYTTLLHELIHSTAHKASSKNPLPPYKHSVLMETPAVWGVYAEVLRTMLEKGPKRLPIPLTWAEHNLLRHAPMHTDPDYHDKMLGLFSTPEALAFGRLRFREFADNLQNLSKEERERALKVLADPSLAFYPKYDKRNRTDVVYPIPGYLYWPEAIFPKTEQTIFSREKQTILPNKGEELDLRKVLKSMGVSNRKITEVMNALKENPKIESKSPKFEKRQSVNRAHNIVDKAEIARRIAREFGIPEYTSETRGSDSATYGVFEKQADPNAFQGRLTPELAGVYSRVKPIGFRDIRSRDQFIAHLPTVELYVDPYAKYSRLPEDIEDPSLWRAVHNRIADRALKLRGVAPRGIAPVEWGTIEGASGGYNIPSHKILLDPNVYRQGLLLGGREIGPDNFPNLYRRYYGEKDTPLSQTAFTDLANFMHRLQTMSRLNRFYYVLLHEIIHSTKPADSTVSSSKQKVLTETPAVWGAYAEVLRSMLEKAPSKYSIPLSWMERNLLRHAPMHMDPDYHNKILGLFDTPEARAFGKWRFREFEKRIQGLPRDQKEQALKILADPELAFSSEYDRRYNENAVHPLPGYSYSDKDAISRQEATILPDKGKELDLRKVLRGLGVSERKIGEIIDSLKKGLNTMPKSQTSIKQQPAQPNLTRGIKKKSQTNSAGNKAGQPENTGGADHWMRNIGEGYRKLKSTWMQQLTEWMDRAKGSTNTFLSDKYPAVRKAVQDARTWSAEQKINAVDNLARILHAYREGIKPGFLRFIDRLTYYSPNRIFSREFIAPAADKLFADKLLNYGLQELPRSENTPVLDAAEAYLKNRQLLAATQGTAGVISSILLGKNIPKAVATRNIKPIIPKPLLFAAKATKPVASVVKDTVAALPRAVSAVGNTAVPTLANVLIPVAIAKVLRGVDPATEFRESQEARAGKVEEGKERERIHNFLAEYYREDPNIRRVAWFSPRGKAELAESIRSGQTPSEFIPYRSRVSPEEYQRYLQLLESSKKPVPVERTRPLPPVYTGASKEDHLEHLRKLREYETQRRNERLRPYTPNATGNITPAPQQPVAAAGKQGVPPKKYSTQVFRSRFMF